MNAMISGQAGVALLIDGMELSSLHADRMEEVVSRQPAEIPYLLGDARDLQFLEGVEVAEVGCRLDLATTQMDALHLALILLDPTLAEDTRRTAAEELEEVLVIPEVSGFVAAVLYAHPIPRDGDLIGAELSCTARTDRVRRFLQNLTGLQSTIAEVRMAWEQIPTAAFGTETDRACALSVAVREGLFRDLVRLRKEHASRAEFRRNHRGSDFSRVGNHGKILDAWLSYLSPDRGSRARQKPRARVIVHGQRQIGGWVREEDRRPGSRQRGPAKSRGPSED